MLTWKQRDNVKNGARKPEHVRLKSREELSTFQIHSRRKHESIDRQEKKEG